MKLDKCVQRVFDKCNLIGEDVDVYSELIKYKAIRNLTNKEIDEIYNEIARGLGF